MWVFHGCKNERKREGKIINLCGEKYEEQWRVWKKKLI